MSTPYDFLLDTYETETLKTLTIWRAFPPETVDFRPAPKSRSVLEQFEHQLQSEGRWMQEMLGISTGEWLPANRTREDFYRKYEADTGARLEQLRAKPAEWWAGQARFFDVDRSRAWIMTRRLTHSAHHRAQLIVYLRVLGLRVPSVYGPTADTDGKVQYSFASDAA